MSAVEVPPEHPGNEPQSISEEIVEGQVDTTETKMRYLAYANRFRTIAVASSRYLAYTSGSFPTLFPNVGRNGFRCRRSIQKRYSSLGGS